MSFPNYTLAAPNECDYNFIEVFGEKTDLKHRIRQFCGSTVETVVSKSNVMHVRFYAELRVVRSSFDALFTAITLYRGNATDGKRQPRSFMDFVTKQFAK